MYNLMTLLSTDITGGLSGPLNDPLLTKDTSDLKWIIPILIFAAIIFISLEVILIKGFKKKIWNNHKIALVLVLLGILMSGIVTIFLFIICLSYI